MWLGRVIQTGLRDTLGGGVQTQSQGKHGAWESYIGRVKRDT